MVWAKQLAQGQPQSLLPVAVAVSSPPALRPSLGQDVLSNGPSALLSRLNPYIHLWWGNGPNTFPGMLPGIERTWIMLPMCPEP